MNIQHPIKKGRGRRWIRMARVWPRFVCIGQAGAMGYSLLFSGRADALRPGQYWHWREILAAVRTTLRLHRLAMVSCACVCKREDGRHDLVVEVARTANSEQEGG